MKSFEHPEKSGIVIAETANIKAGQRYGTSWQVRIPAKLTGGTRERAQFPTREEAFRFADDRFLALKKHGTAFAELPPAQQQEAVMAWRILKEAGLGFVESARVAVKVLRPAGGTKTVADVVAEMVASKETRAKAKELDEGTVADFKVRAKSLTETFGTKAINLLTVDDVKSWLAGVREKKAQRTTLNFRNCIAEILRHAKASRYTHENVMEYFTREDYARLGGEKASKKVGDIGILSVDDAEKLLTAAAKQAGKPLLASLALRLFCGTRTTETYKLTWEDVHWQDAKPYVHVSETIAKKRRIRLVDIPENALAWLSLCAKETGKVSPKNTVADYFAAVTALADKADVTMPKNATRHSFGSYHYALHGDSIKTSTQMGHKQGDDVLFAHYRQLVRPGAAERFFNLRPAPGAGKVVKFPELKSA
ncbi:phage integrase family protein [Opitutaceae bacterium TAV1]|nr:phage integrase family protein [Opitutaceae bacterium TAV1]